MRVAKQHETIVQTSGVTSSRYYDSGVWRCSSSPTGAHHWLVNSRGMGQCKYCGERRQFADSLVADYVDADVGLPGQDVLTQESLKELLPIA